MYAIMYVCCCDTYMYTSLCMLCFNCNDNHVFNHAIRHGVRIGPFVMAAGTLQPPAPFCFHRTDEWPKWKRRFEQYRQASGLAVKGDECQVTTLLYCLGDDAEDVLDPTRITADNKKYSKVVDAFDDYFKVQKDIIFML